MAELNFEYITRSLAALSGIPVRLYGGKTLLFSWFPVRLPRDPITACLKEVLSVQAHVGYYVTPLFHYYGVIKADGRTIVIGPTAQIMASEQELKELAFQIDVPKDEIPAFVEGMNSIIHLPAESLLQMLCAVNHFINNGEMLELTDLAIQEEEQTRIKNGVEKQRTSRVYDEAAPAVSAHNTLAIEEALMGIVRSGDTVALRRWLASAPAVQGGTVAGDQLRQLRNLFIVTVTLTSRAAIRGGMREDDAFSLSDAFIQRVELLTSPNKILNLQYLMLLEFTEQVEKLRRDRYATRLSLDVANYVQHHLSEKISVDRMAEELYLSRPYLSGKFKKETGQTLTDYILNEKTEEAKRLLRYSDKPLSAISAYLGFSSHGHFARVFKKYAGVTPNEYRESPRS